MKLLSALLATSYAKSDYQKLLSSIRDGTNYKQDRGTITRNFADASECPQLPTGSNGIEQWNCVGESCTAICKLNAGLLPNGNNANGAPKLRCKKPKANKGETVPYWNKDPPICSSCDPDNFDAEPVVTDPKLDLICATGLKNMKECTMTCTNGATLDGRKNVKLKCFCDKKDAKKGCYWKNSRGEMDPNSFACEQNVPPTSPPTDSCDTKDTTCTTLPKWAISYKNSWTCRNCFRINAAYNMKQVGVNNWEGTDYLDIDFRYKVAWISYGHPIRSVEDRGKMRWRVHFKHNANFVSGMRWDANLRTLHNEWINDETIIRGASSCPCSNDVGATPAPWKNNNQNNGGNGNSGDNNSGGNNNGGDNNSGGDNNNNGGDNDSGGNNNSGDNNSGGDNNTGGDNDTCNLGPDLAGVSKGHLTHYQLEPTGGNCDLDWNYLRNSGVKGWTHFAALPKGAGMDAYENSKHCGRCVKVKCSCEQSMDWAQGACQNGGQETILMVVDSCPTCNSAADIDLGTGGWSDITGGMAPSKFDGTWDFVECPAAFVDGNTKIRVKTGSSPYWYAIQPVGNKHPITNIEVTDGSGTVANMVFGSIDGFWWESSVHWPTKITLTNSEGQTATYSISNVNSDFVAEEMYNLDQDL